MVSLRLTPITTIREIDPITDRRWSRFLARHHDASVFHTAEWLDALKRTYGYTPAVLTTAEPGMELTHGLVFCRVESWLTGPRVVSVPFSDHCMPLVQNNQELALLISHLKDECLDRGEYIELRAFDGRVKVPDGFSVLRAYTLHKLDLRPSLDDLFQRLHPSCIQRKILQARREEFWYEEVQSEGDLREFYRLAVLTRRRQHLPPQPFAWFQNLMACLGDKLRIRLLFHSDQAVAGVLTIRFRKTITYKYGFSDKRYHRLGCMQLLLWNVIEEAKGAGLVELDLGRSGLDNEGLIVFKDRWGAERSKLVYLRHPKCKSACGAKVLESSIARRMVSYAPDRLLITAGRLLYRHIG